MNAVRALLACPACGGPLSPDWSCARCGTTSAVVDGIPTLRVDVDARTEAVRRFYGEAPFPGYAAGETLQSLRARAMRHPFVRRLDQSIPSDARIVDVGCGTGQMCLALARADRVVIGADLTRASIELGAAAAVRFGLADRVQFVETDLRRPGLAAGAFDVVHASGVLHHTPDPRASFGRLAALVRPGGIIVIGLYNVVARLPTRLRRLAFRLSGSRYVPFDPVLRDRSEDEDRRRAWLRDQYQHPEEHRHSVGEVQRWFAAAGVEFLRTYPSVVWDDTPDDLFTPAPDNWWIERGLAQAGWMWSLGREGGLFLSIGRKRPAEVR